MATTLPPYLNFTDKAEQQAAWDRLGDGGTVIMALGEQFFGCFGMLVDRYGIHWRLHAQ